MTNDLARTSAGGLTSQGDAFRQFVDMVAPADGPGIVSARSARVYRHTYKLWRAYAGQQGRSPLDLNYGTAREFLKAHPASQAVQQQRLSALKTLAQAMAVFDPDRFQRASNSLKLLEGKHVPGAIAIEHRERRALTPAQADRLLRWCDEQAEHADDKHRTIALRNRAIVATLLLTGLRRAELAALRWQDIDFNAGVVSVRHGKGDKAREAAIYSEAAIEALRAWRAVQPEGYTFVFVGLRRGGTFTGDKPMDTSAIWRVVTAAAEGAGIGHLKPHDLRRSLATELLETGSPVHHVQNQLGHSNPDTTLKHYAGATDARQRRRSARVRYG